MRRHFLNRNIVVGLVSLAFAILLFIIATSNEHTMIQTQVNRRAETYSHTLESVPIDIKYDSDEYFISGYNYEAEVYLTSTNRVKLDSEINSDTRQFKVVADLTSLGEGTAKVPLQVRNLPDDVSATVSPTNMNVVIGKKATKKFPVQVTFADNNFASGYELDSYQLDKTTVEVVSDETTIGQIDHVMATLPENTVLKGDYAGDVTLQAVSASGVVLPAIITPAKTQLTVSVNKLSKTVPIKVKYVGTLDSQLSDVKYDLSFDKVEISGSQEALDAVSEVTATVDISGVTQSTTQTVSLDADKVTISPKTVDVNLSVVKKK